MITGIVGLDRGGTSATAAVVMALGVKMYGHPRTLDDHELFGVSPQQMCEVLEKREGDWAWKYPLDISGFDLDFTDRFIIILRDAVARGIHNGKQANWERVKEGIRRTDALLNMTILKKKPHLFISYEKLLVKTEETVKEIADFLDLPVNEIAINVVNAEKGYKNVEELTKYMLK